jgi:hypothetical protein
MNEENPDRVRDAKEIQHGDDRAAAERDVAERHADRDREPHHDLNHPAEGADPTEYPDPYDRRPDPRDPAAVDTPASRADPKTRERSDDPPRAPSTSEPHPPRNVETARREGFEPER